MEAFLMQHGLMHTTGIFFLIKIFQAEISAQKKNEKFYSQVGKHTFLSRQRLHLYTWRGISKPVNTELTVAVKNWRRISSQLPRPVAGSWDMDRCHAEIPHRTAHPYLLQQLSEAVQLRLQLFIVIFQNLHPRLQPPFVLPKELSFRYKFWVLGCMMRRHDGFWRRAHREAPS